MCTGRIYGHFSRTRGVADKRGRGVSDLRRKRGTENNNAVIPHSCAKEELPAFVSRGRTRNRPVVDREDLTQPKLRVVSSGLGPGETRVSLPDSEATARRKGNGVTCESSGTRNVFAKTGGSCGGGPDVFTTRIRLYKTVPVFLYRAASPRRARRSPLFRADCRLRRCNVDTMRSTETKNS